MNLYINGHLRFKKVKEVKDIANFIKLAGKGNYFIDWICIYSPSIRIGLKDTSDYIKITCLKNKIDDLLNLI